MSIGGEGSPSLPSAPVTPRAQRPDPPLAVAALPGYGSVVVEFEPPVFDGNSPITSYTVVVTDVLANEGADPSTTTEATTTTATTPESPLTAAQTFVVGERSPSRC